MRFTYKARTKEGKIQRGSIEAFSRKSALDILEKYKFYVTSLKKETKVGFLSKKVAFGKGINPKNIAVFTRQFSVMLRSGISPVEAMRAQVVQTNNSDFREKILTMTESVEGGGALSQAFSLYPKIFSSFFVNIVRSGEATGKVAESLDYLADHLEREYNLHQQIKGAMIYPAFIIVVFLGAFFLIVFFVIPKLTEVFEGFGGEIPLLTRLIISVSEFTRKGGWILIFVVFAGLFFLPQYFKRSKEKREFYDKIILKLPILGDFNKKVYLTRFSENLSVLIKAGLPITQALKVTGDIIENVVYKKIINEAQEKVARGEKISSVFNRYPEQIPFFVSQMISTGEETGKLDETLMNIVEFYRQEVERTTENLTSILEPILIAVLGLGIGILAISIFIPLFRMGLGGMGT